MYHHHAANGGVDLSTVFVANALHLKLTPEEENVDTTQFNTGRS
jgi:hypothetical protein